MNVRPTLLSLLLIGLSGCKNDYDKICIITRLPDELVCERNLNKIETEKIILLLELEGEDFYLNDKEEIFYRPSYSEEFNTVIWNFSDKVQDSLAYKERIIYLMNINKLEKLPDIERIKNKRKK